MARRDALLRLHKTLVARRAALRDALAGEVASLGSIQTRQIGDSADGAFDAGSDELSTQLAELEARELNQIERALTRLSEGTYGTCEVCQVKIPVARLNTLPYSTTCINCQRKMEHHPGFTNGRRGGDWERLRDAESPQEDRRDVNLGSINRDLSRNF